MAILSEAAKKKVPKSHLGVPSKKGTGSYPMPDKEHAVAAVGLAAMHGHKALSSKLRKKGKSLGLIKGGKKLSDLA